MLFRSSEAIKASMPIGDAVKAAASNGWGGFKASWLQNSANGTRQAPGNVRQSPQSALEARNAETVRKFLEKNRAAE